MRFTDFDFTDFNFAHAGWLWLLLAVPIVAALHLLWRGGASGAERLRGFIDPHLLPHLLRKSDNAQRRSRWPLVFWCVVWTLSALALAGPRWNFTDVEASKPDRDLVILLDLSKSMDTRDLGPSRLERARQEIGDIIDAEQGLNIGLVAFAAIPHLVVPLTDDMGTIRHIPAVPDDRPDQYPGQPSGSRAENGGAYAGRDPRRIEIYSDRQRWRVRGYGSGGFFATARCACLHARARHGGGRPGSGG